MFSKSCEYGIRAAIIITSESSKGNRIGIKEIAKRINSPEAFTGKILQILVKHNIVKSNKGPTGGFDILADYAKQIMLSDIVEAIDGDDIFNGCALGLPNCGDESPCPAHSRFKTIRTQLKEMLTTTSLEQLSINYMNDGTYLKI